MSKKQKQNPKEEQTKVTKEEMAKVMSFLDFAKYMEAAEGIPQPETIPDPFSHLRSLFGMNRDDTIAFAKKVVDLLKLSKQQRDKGAMEEQQQTHHMLSEMYNQKRSQGEIRKAALASSGFLTHREAFDAMGVGFANNATHERTRRLEAAAAADAAVVNQENKPSWWQQKQKEIRGNQGKERRLAATRIQAIQRRKLSAKKVQKLKEEKQKKGGRKSRRRRKSRKKRKSRKPKKRRKRKTHRRKTRKKRTKRR